MGNASAMISAVGAFVCCWRHLPGEGARALAAIPSCALLLALQEDGRFLFGETGFATAAPVSALSAAWTGSAAYYILAKVPFYLETCCCASVQIFFFFRAVLTVAVPYRMQRTVCDVTDMSPASACWPFCVYIPVHPLIPPPGLSRDFTMLYARLSCSCGCISFRYRHSPPRDTHTHVV